MSLYDALADDIDRILVDVHGPGESVTYHPYGGDDVVISAVLSPELANLLENEHGGESDVREGYLFVSKTVDTGIVSPDVRDTVTIRSEVWAIVVINDHGGYWKLFVRKSTRVRDGAARFMQPRL